MSTDSAGPVEQPDSTPRPASSTAQTWDVRSIPTLSELIDRLSTRGEPLDPRTDIDPASLERRFPHLAGVETLDITVDGPHGPVHTRRYRHATATPTGAGLVWVHGGAFVGGHLDMPESDWVARELAARGIPVVAVDYTKCLGQAHYPIPSDDVLAAWHHVRASSQDLIGVSADSLALGGGSAGATLSAGAVTRLRDAGEPLPAKLLLVYPVVHPNGPEASTVIDPSSFHGQAALNFAGTVEAFTDPHVFAGTGDGHGFPSTLIVVCENDDLRPSGERFAEALREAGVAVTRYLEPDAEHGHINNPGDAGALRTLGFAADWLAATQTLPWMTSAASMPGMISEK